MKIIPDHGGSINSSHIVAIGSARSAPIKRLLAATNPERLLHTNYGYPRESVILLDNGFIVVTSIPVNELTALLCEGAQDE